MDVTLPVVTSEKFPFAWQKKFTGKECDSRVRASMNTHIITHTSTPMDAALHKEGILPIVAGVRLLHPTVQENR